MFVKYGTIPCDYFKVNKMIADILIEMNIPLMSITEDNFYCFSYTKQLQEGIEILLIEYGDILERSIANDS